MRKRNWDAPEYKKWRKAVFKRDNYKCRMPDCKSKAKQAHHIRRWSDYISLRYDINNGISLCYNCHKKIAGRELYYIPIFSRIVRNTK